MAGSLKMLDATNTTDNNNNNKNENEKENGENYLEKFNINNKKVCK